MTTKLLTGTSASVTAAAVKLIASNPNWTVGQFTAGADPKGETRVALTMELPDTPKARIMDLTICTGTEKTAKANATKTLKSHPCWRIRQLAIYTRPEIKDTQLAALLIQEAP